MVKHELMIIANYSQESFVTLDELCEICNISSDVIHELIAHEIIHPKQTEHYQWKINFNELTRAKTALRLQRDLEVNFAGAALALDLLEELNDLRNRIEFLEYQLLKR